MCYENISIETAEPRNRSLRRGEYTAFFLEDTFNGHIEDEGHAYVVYDSDDNIICHLWKGALNYTDFKLFL